MIGKKAVPVCKFKITSAMQKVLDKGGVSLLDKIIMNLDYEDKNFGEKVNKLCEEFFDENKLKEVIDILRTLEDDDLNKIINVLIAGRKYSGGNEFKKSSEYLEHKPSIDFTKKIFYTHYLLCEFVHLLNDNNIDSLSKLKSYIKNYDIIILYK